MLFDPHDLRQQRAVRAQLQGAIGRRPPVDGEVIRIRQRTARTSRALRACARPCAGRRSSGARGPRRRRARCDAVDGVEKLRGVVETDAIEPAARHRHRVVVQAHHAVAPSGMASAASRPASAWALSAPLADTGDAAVEQHDAPAPHVDVAADERTARRSARAAWPAARRGCRAGTAPARRGCRTGDGNAGSRPGRPARGPRSPAPRPAASRAPARARARP